MMTCTYPERGGGGGGQVEQYWSGSPENHKTYKPASNVGLSPTRMRDYILQETIQKALQITILYTVVLTDDCGCVSAMSFFHNLKFVQTSIIVIVAFYLILIKITLERLR